jgi:hypothetical protein
MNAECFLTYNSKYRNLCNIWKGGWGVAGTVATEIYQRVSAKRTGRSNMFLCIRLCWILQILQNCYTSMYYVLVIALIGLCVLMVHCFWCYWWSFESWWQSSQDEKICGLVFNSGEHGYCPNGVPRCCNNPTIIDRFCHLGWYYLSYMLRTFLLNNLLSWL